MSLRLLEIIEKLTKTYEEQGDIEVLKITRTPQIKEIRLRKSKLKPYDNYVLID